MDCAIEFRIMRSSKQDVSVTISGGEKKNHGADQSVGCYSGTRLLKTCCNS